ncbi:UNVERIFIED_CONTAM: hypothetical protein FKN15_069107 [Acipenser sinensis]
MHTHTKPVPLTMPVPMVNGSLLEPLPPPVVRKGCPASPSNMMETSIDEGIETEGPECEEDPLLVCTAFQSSRYGQRRHTLSEVSNQPGMAPSAGKLFAMSTDPSLGSMDSEYETGSVHSDLSLLEEPPGLSRMTPPFIGMRPPNPVMQALSAQKREAHNRSPVSFREGRRASDTSLTQGTVAFRQHLQNLARTKGILELNKVQMLYEQMGSSEDPALASTAPHLQDLLDRQQQGEPPQQQEDVSMFQNPIHPQLLSRRQSLETQYLTHRLQKILRSISSDIYLDVLVPELVNEHSDGVERIVSISSGHLGFKLLFPASLRYGVFCKGDNRPQGRDGVQ